MRIRSGGTSPSSRSTAWTRSGRWGRGWGRRVTQHCGDARRELARAERLGEQPGAQALRFSQNAVFALGGEDDDGKRAGRRGGPELAQELEAGAVGQMEIEQHGVEWPVAALQRPARFGERAGENHDVAEALEVRAEQQPDIRLVIDDEEVPPDGPQGGRLGVRAGRRSPNGGGAGRRAGRPRWWTAAPERSARRRR